MIKRLFTFITFFLILSSAKSQFYNTGNDPTKLKWYKIDNEYCRIVFPSGAEKSAQNFANTLHLSALETSSGLNSEVRKPIKIVMHNQSVISNGYVVWAPRRMELTVTPPQNIYAQDWMDQLTLHEYRHVCQLEKLNQGFTRGVSLFTGEIGIGLTASILPLWFLEGDAVVNETVLSNTGRGREPSFSERLRAIELQSKKRLTYDQVYLGTYKTAAPNHYEFGYQMVAYAKTKYNKSIWENVLNRVAKQSFTTVPFYLELKKQTNGGKTRLYNQTFDYLGTKWKNELEKKGFEEYEKIETNYNSNFVSYKFPYETKDGSIIAIRTSIDDISRLVKIQNGEETVIKSLGSFYGSQIDYSDDYVVWEELRTDPRWEQRTFSIIKLYNIQTNNVTVLKKGERHFSPSLSPSAERIAVQKVYSDNRSTIQVFDIKSKELLGEYEHPEKLHMTYNKWLNDSSVAIVTVGKKGKSIYKLNFNSGEWEELLEETFSNITNLSSTDDYLYFTFTHDGKQNIYALNLKNKMVSRVTNTKIGADFVSLSPDKKRIYFSEYSINGYKINKTTNDTGLYVRKDKIPSYRYTFVDKLADQSTLNVQDTNFAFKTYKAEKYDKWGDLINVHSWLVPFYADIDEASSDISGLTNTLRPGVTVFSQNLLSTVTTSVGYSYKDGYHYFNPSIYLTGLYPVISLSMDYGGARVISTGDDTRIKVTSLGLNTRVSVPLRFSTNRYRASILPSAKLGYTNRFYLDTVQHKKVSYDYLVDGIYYYKGVYETDLGLSVALSSVMSYKDIRPRLGLSFFVSHKNLYSKTGLLDEYTNTVYLASAYIPGFYRHHSFTVTGGVEDGRGDRMALPRGYADEDVYSFLNSEKLAFTYTLPLVYPDLSLGPVAYIKRIHADLFYDRTDFKTQVLDSNKKLIDYSGNYSSIGVDLGLEMNFLRFFFPLVPTIRYSYLETISESRFSFYVTSSYNFSFGKRNHPLQRAGF